MQNCSMNDNEPATKADLNAVRTELKGDIAKLEKTLRLDLASKTDLADAVNMLRSEMTLHTEMLRNEMNVKTAEIIRHFYFKAEQIRHDVGSANEEEITQLERRVTHLEAHCGVPKG